MKDQNQQLTLTIKEKQHQQLLAQKNTLPAVESRLKEYRKISKELRYPWNQVFAPIEQSNEPGVALLNLLHDQATEHTQLVVEAIDTTALIRYVARLNEGDDDNPWYIATYQIQTQSTPNTVKATITNKF